MNASEQPVTAALATLAAEVDVRALDDSVATATTLVLLDLLACAIGATTTQRASSILSSWAEIGGSGTAAVWGGGTTSPIAAAATNAELANTLDLDETLHNWGHIACYTFPVAVAAGERSAVSGAELINGLAIAYEVAARIGSGLSANVLLTERAGSLETSSPVRWGYGFCAMGGAAGAARLLRQPVSSIRHAIGIAAHQSAVGGSTRWHRLLPARTTKYAPAGAIAVAGLNAASLAGRGITGDDETLDEPDGYAALVGSDFWAPELVLDGLGERWLISETSYKPYCCCRYLHPVIALVERAMAEERISPASIERIEVELMSRASATSVFAALAADSEVGMQFSLPMVVAATVHGRHRGLHLIDPETLASPEIRQLATKVSFATSDEAIHERYRAHGLRPVQEMRALPASIRIVTNGATVVRSTRHAPGDPWAEETRFTDGDVQAKFRSVVAPVVGESAADRLAGRILALDREPDAADVFADVARTVAAARPTAGEGTRA